MEELFELLKQELEKNKQELKQKGSGQSPQISKEYADA
jgi:hypothetical protein